MAVEPFHSMVHNRPRNQIQSVCFENRGLIYMFIIPLGTTINVNCFMRSLGNFTKNLKKLRPKMVEKNGVSLGAMFL
jgi:hypothetical protein